MASHSFRLGLPALLAALSLGACGGKSFGSGGDGSDAGTTGVGGSTNNGGSSAHAGSATAGSSDGGAETGGTSVGGSSMGGSSACDSFDNQPAGTVDVRLRNETEDAIYLGQSIPGCARDVQFTVADATGMPLQAPGFCVTTCQDIRRGALTGCPAAACAGPSALTLEPGEGVLQQWNARFLADLTLPRACRPAAGTSTCQQLQAVTPGEFTFIAQASTSIDCTQFGGGDCMTCTPQSSGGCRTFEALLTPPLLMAETTVTLDASYGIGAPASDGTTRTVEIVFK